MASNMVLKRQKMCGRKKGYPTQNQANKAGFRHHTGKFNTYECPHCHMWHVTTAAYSLSYNHENGA